MAGFYSVLKHIRYWTLNPDQDTPNPALSPPGPVDTIRGATTHGSGLRGTRISESTANGDVPVEKNAAAPPGHAHVSSGVV